MPGVVLLDAEPAPANDTSAIEVPQYKWIHCCNEGEYRGHHQGAFNMTPTVLEAFVRNFRAHPQYKAGGLQLGGGQTYTGGIAPVLQFDYEHASECPPWEGSIPKDGAPACAWALELELRKRPDGKVALWAFAELLDDLRKQIKARTQRWVSIAFTLSGVHWITGEEIGPMLTSIAITNHPFMLDLEPIAASRRTSQPAPSAIPSPGNPSEAPGDKREPTSTGAHMDVKLRERICRSLKIQALADDAAVGDAVEEAVKSGGSLKSLLEALGVPQVDDALKAIPELRNAREKLAGLLSELDALMAQEATADAAVGKADVGAAMRAGKLSGTGAEEALTVHRSHLIDSEVQKVRASKKPGDVMSLSEKRDAMAKGRKAFLSKYGVDADKVHLTTSFVAGPGGQQLEPPKGGGAPLVIEPRSEGDKPVIDLRNVPGPNPTLRYVAHLRATDKGFAALPYQAQLKRVSQLRPTVELQLE